MTGRDIERLIQCITCKNDPETCGCDDKDEDSEGMCVCWAERKEYEID